MNTPSHWLINAVTAKRLDSSERGRGAFLWGSIAPDIPLYLLSVGGAIYYHWILGWDLEQAFRYMFSVLFFQDPLWIIGHNTLHSPAVLILGLLGLGYLRYRVGQQQRWIHWIQWFLLGCLLHTVVDIPVHVDDGPLLLFPFNWSARFRSVISYWDPRYFGREVFVCEVLLDAYLLWVIVGPHTVKMVIGLTRKLRGG